MSYTSLHVTSLALHRTQTLGRESRPRCFSAVTHMVPHLRTTRTPKNERSQQPREAQPFPHGTGPQHGSHLGRETSLRPVALPADSQCTSQHRASPHPAPRQPSPSTQPALTQHPGSHHPTPSQPSPGTQPALTRHPLRPTSTRNHHLDGTSHSE